jgi:mRNA-degrading endonuclease RelE of RelBE toxin-antitoxin system
MRFVFSQSAASQFARLPHLDQERLAGKLRFFAEQSDPLFYAKPLIGHDASRFRIGPYRVIFEIYKQLLYITVIDKRKDVYRRM